VAAVFNGNSSVFQVNNNAPTTGAAGAGNAGGLTIGASNAGASPTNIKIKEAICYAGAHDAATRRTIINYLAGVGNITV
jgi:hypothetical protein